MEQGRAAAISFPFAVTVGVGMGTMGSGEKRRVPIFPDWFATEAADQAGNLFGASFVGDLKLFGGARRNLVRCPFAGVPGQCPDAVAAA